MAERTVAVRLSANVNAYIKAMDDARESTRRLEKDSSLNMSRLGSTMSSVGRDMTTKVTLPLVGVGAAAVKMSTNFDDAFAQMVGLAGVAADDVDGLKESVLGLAGETARAPQELAEALYFAASAGLTTEQAMDAVNIAAKAASSGMGTTQDIVGLAASAVASYGAANITAAEATDILVSTIREGRAEPAELASTLGRVLPIASQLGVSFDEVGGAVAVLSNVFGDTNRTVTATQGLFVKLLSPTQQGRDALANMGTSVSELHAAIDQDGLLGALELLKAKGFDTNATALRALFDDIEGFQAASALLATDQEILAGTFGATADSAGSLDTAFGALDEDSQALKQSWVDIQIALIQVGEVLGPIVADIAGGISTLAGAFTELDPTIQKVVIGIAGIAAATGPVLMVTGSLIKNYTLLKGAMAAYNTTAAGQKVSAGALAGALGGVGIALSAAVILYGNYASKKAEAKRKTDDFVAALEAEADGQRDALDSLLARNLADLNDELTALGISTVDVARYIKGDSVPAIEALMGATDRYGSSAEGFKALQQELGIELGGNAADLAKVTGAVESNKEAYDAANVVYDATKSTMDGLAESTANATRRKQFSTTASGELVAAEEELIPVTEDVAEATETFADRLAEAKEAHAELVEQILEGLDGMFSHEESTLRMANAYDDYRVAVGEATDILNDSTLTDGQKAEALRNLRLEEIGLAENAYDTAKAYAEQSGAVEGSKQWVDEMVESLQATADMYPELRDEIDLYIAELGRIPRTIVTDATITFAVNGREVTIGKGANGGTVSVSGRRADGGPTMSGGMYEVLERGRSEILTENGKHYLLSANNGQVTSLDGNMAAAGISDMATMQSSVIRGGDVINNYLTQQMFGSRDEMAWDAARGALLMLRGDS